MTEVEARVRDILPEEECAVSGAAADVRARDPFRVGVFVRCLAAEAVRRSDAEPGCSCESVVNGVSSDGTN